MLRNNLDAPFSAGRVAALMRNRLFDDAPAAGVTAGAIAALNLIALIFGAVPFFNAASARGGPWTLAVVLGGLLLSGNAFSKMHDGRSGPDWVLLPASAAEKYLSALIVYLFIYPLAASGAAMLLSAALLGLGELFGTGGGVLWNPLQAGLLKGAEAYLSVGIVAAAGSARFRKFALGKTAAVLFAAGVASSLLLLFALVATTEEGRQAFASGAFRGVRVHIDMDMAPWKEQVMETMATIFRRISVLFALFYGYALLREKESKDEVQ